jgi:hypothetical protein
MFGDDRKCGSDRTGRKCSSAGHETFNYLTHTRKFRLLRLVFDTAALRKRFMERDRWGDSARSRARLCSNKLRQSESDDEDDDEKEND